MMGSLPGRLSARVYGTGRDRFIKLCKNNGIALKKLYSDGEAYSFQAGWSLEAQLRRYAQTAGAELEIEQKENIGAFLYRNRGRIYFLALLLLAAAGFARLERNIWHITISGNCALTREMLLDFLAENDCSIGARKDGIDCNGLEMRLRSEFPYVTWTSIQIRGTDLLVCVRENPYYRREEENGDILPGAPGTDFVSLDDGTITSFLLRSGTSSLRAGDRVSAGDVVVLGRVPIYNNTGDAVIAYHELCADFDLRIRTDMDYSACQKKWEEVRLHYGGGRRYPYLYIYRYCWRILPKSKEDGEKMPVYDCRQLCLWGDFYLPVYYGTETVYDVSSYVHVISYAEGMERLAGAYADHLAGLAADGTRVLSESHQYVEDEDGLQIHAELQIERNVRLAPKRQDDAPVMDE